MESKGNPISEALKYVRVLDSCSTDSLVSYFDRGVGLEEILVDVIADLGR